MNKTILTITAKVVISLLHKLSCVTAIHFYDINVRWEGNYINLHVLCITDLGEHGLAAEISEFKNVVPLSIMKRNAATIKKEPVSGMENAQQKPYLTKRLLVSAAKRGIRKAAEETMLIMGYTVIAKDGWIVKKYADGTIEAIEQINP